MEDPRNEFDSRTREILCILIDNVFLCLWVAVQAGAGHAIQKLSLDQWLHRPFQVIFGISTLAVVVIWMYRDIRIMWIKAKGRIDLEQDQWYPKRKKSKKDGVNK